jgi:two-component system sensor histidine kinase YesM
MIDTEDEHQSIGLINVQERLHLQYGSKYSLQIESSLGFGTQVTIKIPFMVEQHV